MLYTIRYRPTHGPMAQTLGEAPDLDTARVEAEAWATEHGHKIVSVIAALAFSVTTPIVAAPPAQEEPVRAKPEAFGGNPPSPAVSVKRAG